MSYDRLSNSSLDTEDHLVVSTSVRAKQTRHYTYDDGVEYKRYTIDTGDETGNGGYHQPNYLSDEIVIEPSL